MNVKTRRTLVELNQVKDRNAQYPSITYSKVSDICCALVNQVQQYVISDEVDPIGHVVICSMSIYRSNAIAQNTFLVSYALCSIC